MPEKREEPKPQTLAALMVKLSELEPGVEYPVSENFCRYCESTDVVLLLKLEAVEGSLAGVQLKTSARAWPYLRCRGCGHESRGNAA